MPELTPERRAEIEYLCQCWQVSASIAVRDLLAEIDRLKAEAQRLTDVAEELQLQYAGARSERDEARAEGHH